MTERRQLHAVRQSRELLRRRRLFDCTTGVSAMLAVLLLAGSHSIQAQQPASLLGTPEPPTGASPSQESQPALLPKSESDALPVAAQQPETPIPQAGSIEGVVSSPDGTLYEGARISLSQAGSSPAGLNQLAAADRTATSDGNGHFAFPNVSTGAFQLTVSGDGFATQHIAGVLHPGENYRMPPIVLLVSTATSEVRVTVSSQELAAEELHLEEQQRVFGVFPNFYVVYAPTSPPLSTRQKYHLAWRSSIDPVTILFSGAVAGVEQGNDTFNGYGPGGEGYAKRFAANYADSFIGTFLGGAVFPSLFKQDPRYFVKGTGSIRSRTLYAIANAVICKGDNGHWQFDYSGIIGGLAAGGISNLYYPASNRTGASLTFENTALGIAGSAVGNIFQEFIVRRLTPKLPPPPPAYGTSSQP